MNPNDKQQDPEKDLAKETQKVMNSYMEVLKHQLGRTPTIDELINFVGQQADSQDPQLAGTEPLQKQPLEKDNDVVDQNVAAQLTSMPEQENVEHNNEPSFIHLQIFYGMSKDQDGNSKPDPLKILFYATQDEKVFDVASQEWSDQKPAILAHLPSRPIQYSEHDIMSAIVNGVLDENDFSLLLQADMVSDNAKRVWEKTQELHALMSQYDDSGDIDEDNFDLEPLEDDGRFDLDQVHGLEPLEESAEFTEELGKSDEWESLEQAEDQWEEDSDFGNDVGLEQVDGYQQAPQRQDAKIDQNSDNRGVELIGQDLLSQIMEVAMANPFFSAQQEARIRDIIREERGGKSAVPQQTQKM